MKTLWFGDVSPTPVTAPYFQEKNLTELFTDSLSLFENRDFIFANIECALTEHDIPIKKFGPPLKAPKETADVLKMLGFTCCGISNNHVFDYGIKGVCDTIDALKAVQIDTTGFGENYEDSRKNYTFEQNGERICIVAVCEHEYSYALEDRMGSRPYDEYDTIEDIRKAKEEHDRVIVAYHGGKEMSPYPSPRLRKLCQAMARNGADLILCQHSHCIGCYESYQGSHILYGQGNSHFVKPGKPDVWYTSLAVEYDTKTNAINFVPLQCHEHGIGLALGEKKEAIMGAFAKRNEMLLNGEWRTAWHDFCETRRKDYMQTIAKAGLEASTQRENDRFGHFLDCEAHTDIWRELFPSYNLTNEK